MMQRKRIATWKAEEDTAHICGWDFSHVAGRYVEQELPWNYGEVIARFLRPKMRILDIDTGGGEFLLSSQYPYENTMQYAILKKEWDAK